MMNYNNRDMKLLILSVAAGAGHVQAAKAIKKQAKLDHPDWLIDHIDCLDFLSLPPKKIFFDSYGVITKKAPFLWRWIFNIFNKPNVNKISDKIFKNLILFYTDKIINYINAIKPDIIICTHPTATNIISIQKKNLIKKPKLWTVIIDYEMHLFWVNKESNYFVPTEKIKKELIEKHGLTQKNIIVSGIPIDNIFYQEENSEFLKNKYSLEKNKTILILSGGLGLIRADKIVKEIMKNKNNLNLVAIAGKNINLEEKLKKIKPPKNIIYRPLGWTNRVAEYMKMADIIITKPGGMTVTECLALRKPLIIIKPIPGQEEGNANFLLKNNWAVICKKNKEINKIINSLTKQKLASDWPVKNSAKIIIESIYPTQ